MDAEFQGRGHEPSIQRLANVRCLFANGRMKSESQGNALARIETVDQAVGAGVALRVTCKTCGRSRVVPAQPLEGLARLKRWPTALIPLSCRLRCSTCNGRAVELKPCHDPVDSPAIGPTNEREWHALVRKLRD
jgi:hypothetical protein